MTPPSRVTRRIPLVLATVVVAAALFGLTFTPAVGRALGPVAPWSPYSSTCDAVPVEVLTTAEAYDAVSEIVKPLDGDSVDGGCLAVTVRRQDSATTLQTSSLLPASRAPQIWVPDSSIWARDIVRWPLTAKGHLAQSPVVLATSQARATSLGWPSTRPTWAAFFTGDTPIVKHTVTADAPSMLALMTSYTGASASARTRSTVTSVLGLTRATATSLDAFTRQARTGDAATAVNITSEASVLQQRAAGLTKLVATYPADATYHLDFPVYEVSRDTQLASVAQATDTVAAALLAQDAATIVRAHGLRDTQGHAPTLGATEETTASQRTLELPASAKLTTLVDGMTAFLRPSRLLTVMDVSAPMGETPYGATETRLETVRTAALATSPLLGDQWSVGVWAFGRHVNAKNDAHVQVSAVDVLGSASVSSSHRHAVTAALQSLGSSGLDASGTSLYTSTLDAYKAMLAAYDPDQVNVLVVLTAGIEDDPDGPTLEQTLARFTALHDVRRPIDLVLVGIGSDARMTDLKKIAKATGGMAVSVDDSTGLKKVLISRLAQRAS